jgi:hypothetical protein
MSDFTICHTVLLIFYGDNRPRICALVFQNKMRVCQESRRDENDHDGSWCLLLELVVLLALLLTLLSIFHV